MKAVITAAGKNHRHLPLQTITDAEGQPVSILRLQLLELKAAGIEKAGIVINPGDEALLQDAAGDLADFIECLPQEGGQGYGHAIACARGFVGEEAFLLSIADHLFVSDLPDRNCFQQVMESAVQMQASVSAVQPTRESQIHSFGVVAGDRVDSASGVLRIREVIEKPTPTLAEQRLIVSGLRAGEYLAFFGIHVLQASVFGHLEQLLASADEPARVNLTDAVNLLLNEEDYYAIEVAGRRFDLEAPFGLLHGQVALALKSPAREQVMADLLQLVAER